MVGLVGIKEEGSAGLNRGAADLVEFKVIGLLTVQCVYVDLVLDILDVALN